MRGSFRPFRWFKSSTQKLLRTIAGTGTPPSVTSIDPGVRFRLGQEPAFRAVSQPRFVLTEEAT